MPEGTVLKDGRPVVENPPDLKTVDGLAWTKPYL